MNLPLIVALHGVGSSARDMEAALACYASRDRRYGGLKTTEAADAKTGKGGA